MYPMKMVPVFKDYIWGGNRLKKIYNKSSEKKIIAESWEFSCHKDGVNKIANGIFLNFSLDDLLNKFPEWKGKDVKNQLCQVPVLVKFLDADEPSSIQVHPSDTTANTSLGENGKAEMWYIVDSLPESYVYCGFNKKITKNDFLNLVSSGKIESVLNKIKVKNGDVIYIYPGTVHALGKGIVVAEIQQCSNTTFRIYDYKRKDANGKERELNVKRASEVISYEPLVPDTIRINVSMRCRDFIYSKLFDCQFFKVLKFTILNKINMFCDENTFNALLFLKGTGFIVYKDEKYEFLEGDCFFIPAGMGNYMIQGKCIFLKILA